MIMRKAQRLLQRQYRFNICGEKQTGVKNTLKPYRQTLAINIIRQIYSGTIKKINLAIIKNSSTLLMEDVLSSKDLVKRDNKILITQMPAKLSVIKNFFESIKSPRYSNLNTVIKLATDNTAKDLELQILRNKSHKFHFFLYLNNNPTYMPRQHHNSPTYLHSYFTVVGILKNAKNKTLSGLDKTPMMVLKHHSINIIKDLQTIFNNFLNHAYYPERKKVAKVILIRKKGQDVSDLSGY
ncbi:hypothetical protein M0802_013997 [Mischocyttarus mexicanus]|nr:hypothetical protein M0802_013997 [Mischocyttarus mexicanus]